MNTTTSSTTFTLRAPPVPGRSALDWLFALAAMAGGAFAFLRYAEYMDGYEKGILVGTVPAAIWMAWFWRPARNLMAVVAPIALLAVFAYQGSLANAEKVFWLKYFLSSQLRREKKPSCRSIVVVVEVTVFMLSIP